MTLYIEAKAAKDIRIDWDDGTSASIWRHHAGVAWFHYYPPPEPKADTDPRSDADMAATYPGASHEA